MIRRLLAGILNFLIRWADDSVPNEELQKRLLRAFSIALHRYQEDPSKFSARASADLAGTASDLAKAGLINQVPTELQSLAATANLDLGTARAWRSRLSENKMLIKSTFAVGSGEMLDALDEAGNEEENTFVSACLESLLRHVEVKRKKSLTLTFPVITGSDLFIERQRVILLFCRAASRRKDYRLLNAVFKLNDWSLKAFNPKRQNPDELCSQTRALAAAEACAREMQA